MDKKRLMELAGLSAEYLANASEEDLGNFVEVVEGLKPANEEKGFTTKEINDHYGHVVDIIIHMAKADSDGDKSAYEDNLEAYLEAACDEIGEMVEKRK